MSTAVDRVIDDAIANQTIVGAEILVARDGEIAYRRAAGQFDREVGIAMPENAIYRLASVSKPIVATAALAMIDKGLLSLNDSTADHLPYFRPRLADGRSADITIRHLLTHTAGLGYSYPDDPSITTGLTDTDLSLEENFSRVAQQPLLFAPGTGWNYSVAIDVLGAVLAKVHGGSVGDAVKTHVTGPLGMSETGFFVADKARLAPVYADGKPIPTRMVDGQTVTKEDGGETTFSPSRIFNDKAFQSGGAGMAGTASDLLKLFQALLNGGDGLLKPETLAEAVRNQVGDLPRDDAGLRFGYLGAVVADPAAAGTPQAVGSYEWGGIYGHSWLVDPTHKLIMISMTNTAVEGCTGRFPRDVRDAIYADLL